MDRIRDVIDRVVSDGIAVSPRDGTQREVFPVAIPPSLGDVLTARVRREDAEQTIEIGLGYGVSALYICAGLVAGGRGGARHVAVDPFQITGPDGGGFAGCGLQVLDDAGLTAMIEHHAEESQIALPRFVSEQRSFDFAFVDGNHRFERVFLDLYYLGRLVRPGGVVVLDDYELPGIAKAVSFFVNNCGWTVEQCSEPAPLHEWVVLRTPTAEDTRPYFFFVDF